MWVCSVIFILSFPEFVKVTVVLKLITCISYYVTSGELELKTANKKTWRYTLGGTSWAKYHCGTWYK